MAHLLTKTSVDLLFAFNFAIASLVAFPLILVPITHSMINIRSQGVNLDGFSFLVVVVVTSYTAVRKGVQDLRGHFRCLGGC